MSATLATIKSSGHIRVGYFEGPPNAYTDPTSGQATGESPEILRHIAEAQGWQVDFSSMDFAGLIPGLQANQIDAISGGLYIKPSRCAAVSFSNPTYKDGSGMAVKAGNPLNLHSYADVAANPQVRFGGTSASFELQIAQQAGITAAQTTEYPTNEDLVAALVAGRVDAVASTYSILNALIQKTNNPAIAFVTDFQDPVVAGKPQINVGGLVFRQGDDDLIQIFNAGIAAALSSGWQLQNLQKFGFTDKNLPPDGATAAQYCTAPPSPAPTT